MTARRRRWARCAVSPSTPTRCRPANTACNWKSATPAGESVTPDFVFTVPPLPIQIEIEGLAQGEVLRESADLGVALQSSQFPVTDIEYALNGVPLPDVENRVTLQAAALEPGAATLDVSVRNAGGQVETASLDSRSRVCGRHRAGGSDARLAGRARPGPEC